MCLCVSLLHMLGVLFLLGLHWCTKTYRVLVNTRLKKVKKQLDVTTKGLEHCMEPLNVEI